CTCEARERAGRMTRENAERIDRELRAIAKERAAIDAREARCLQEAEREQIWRLFGYGSMVDYMGGVVGPTPRVALERLRVARALAGLPQIAAALEGGQLPFTAARELTRVATPETEKSWLQSSIGSNVRDVEQLVSGHLRGDLPESPKDPA